MHGPAMRESEELVAMVQHSLLYVIFVFFVYYQPYLLHITDDPFHK